MLRKLLLRPKQASGSKRIENQNRCYSEIVFYLSNQRCKYIVDKLYIRWKDSITLLLQQLPVRLRLITMLQISYMKKFSIIELS